MEGDTLPSMAVGQHLPGGESGPTIFKCMAKIKIIGPQQNLVGKN